jgi:TPR repeat protein
MRPEKKENIRMLKQQIAGIISKGKVTKEYFILLRQLADQGDSDALATLGTFLRDGYRDSRGRVLLSPDPKASMQCYLLGAAQGNTYAMIAVADLLAAGGRKGALSEAENLYKLAFKLGDSMGAYSLACTYHGLGRCSEAVRWFQRCLKAGDLSALVPLAYAELYGAGVRRNVKAAFIKLRRIARGGKFFCQFDQEEAMLTMAEAFRNGWLVRRDLNTAFSWLRRAAKLGSAAAQGYLEDYNACAEHDHSRRRTHSA